MTTVQWDENGKILEKLRYAVRMDASGVQLREVDAWWDHLFDRMAYRLTADVLAEKLVGDEYHISTQEPATWWQMWKRDHAPAWLVRRWPVLHRPIRYVVSLTRYGTYPKSQIQYPALGPVVLREQVNHMELPS